MFVATFVLLGKGTPECRRLSGRLVRFEPADSIRHTVSGLRVIMRRTLPVAHCRLPSRPQRTGARPPGRKTDVMDISKKSGIALAVPLRRAGLGAGVGRL